VRLRKDAEERQAFYNKSAGVVFVMDTEGDQTARMDELASGRIAEFPEFPMAIGAPHPCIEVWLLGDPAAIKKGMSLQQSPQVPEVEQRIRPLFPPAVDPEPAS
jgi:hypothetical protein